MRKMKQTTPDVCGETPTNAAPVAFSLNQNSALCLPLVSDSHKLIWVHSNQIDLQMEGAAELDKAFDRFPYLTQKQTAALAQRCSLHPDQVKVWFMVQRLRYGISWEYKDIHKIRRTLSRGKEELQNRTVVKEARGQSKKWKREGKESDGKRAGDVREDQIANEWRMTGGNMGADKRVEREMKQEQPVKKEKDRKVEEDKKNTQEKRKRPMVADKLGKKRVKQGDEGVGEGAGDAEIKSDEGEREWQKSPQMIATLFTRKKKKQAKENQRLLSIQEWQDASPALNDHQTPNIFMTPVMSAFEGKTEVEAKLEGEGQAEGSSILMADAPHTQIRWSRKTRTQLATLKASFAHCQYPDSWDYSQLEMLTGVPRYTLVQWFGDMRYYIKKKRPRWMNQEQHRQALANIRYQQCLSGLSKALPGEGGGRATWKMKPEKDKSSGEDESVQVPREEK